MVAFCISHRPDKLQRLLLRLRLRLRHVALGNVLRTEARKEQTGAIRSVTLSCVVW